MFQKILLDGPVVFNINIYAERYTHIYTEYNFYHSNHYNFTKTPQFLHGQHIWKKECNQSIK